MPEIQLMSFKDRLAESYKLLEQQEFKNFYIENITVLLTSLEIMHEKKIITTDQFNSRVSSFLNIITLVDEITSIEEHEKHYLKE